MSLSIEELIGRILTFLTKELNDPQFMAELTALLTAFNNWLEAQIVAQGGTSATTGSPTPPAPPPPSGSPTPSTSASAQAVVRPQVNAIKPTVYHR